MKGWTDEQKADRLKQRRKEWAKANADRRRNSSRMCLQRMRRLANAAKAAGLAPLILATHSAPEAALATPVDSGPSHA